MKRRIETIYLTVFAVFTLFYLVWRIGWTLPKGHGALSLIFALILFLTEMIGLAEMMVHFYTVWNRRAQRRDLPEFLPGQLPEVDVLIPTRGEPVELLERTLRACLAMEYDGPDKVHIWLCDDADRPEMKALADSLRVGYFSRRNGKDAKAGNLNAALAQTHSPLVAVFDADMCPEPQFLLRTAPYFLSGAGKGGKRALSDRFGFVQTPQCFRDYDLFQRAFRLTDRLPNEQDFFYRSLEPARGKINAVIFGGSNTLLSRKALESVGGFVTGTLTEDFATGIELEKRGYVCMAVDEPLAFGLSPENLSGMIRQRSRWARGCIQSGRKTKILTAGRLSFIQRLSYLAAVNYWYAPLKRLIYLMAPLMFAVFGVTVMTCDFTQMLLFWLPMYLMAVIGIRLFSDGIRTARWSDIYELCLFPFLLIPVILETLGFRKKEFAVTSKAKSGRGGWKAVYLLPFLALIALSVWGILNTVKLTLAGQTTIYLLLLFWLVFNLYELLHAFLFVCACRSLPEAEEKDEKARFRSVKIGRGTGLATILFRILFRNNHTKEAENT